MGPTRFLNEPSSSYRRRYAAYSFVWFVGLGLLLLMLAVIKPWSQASSGQFVVFFLYIGAGLGTTAGALSSASFLIGSLWSAWLERDGHRELAWHKAKMRVGSGALLLMGLGMLLYAFYSLASGETVTFSRRALPIHFSQNPGWYVIHLGVWFSAGLYLLMQAWKQHKRANAT